MAYQHEGAALKISLVAGADLSAKQYHFVKLDGSGNAVACAATTDTPIGVLLNKPASGESAAILCAGVSKVSASAPVAIGAGVGVVNGGQGVTVAGPSANPTVGRALTAAGGAGEIFTAAINCLNAQPTA